MTSEPILTLMTNLAALEAEESALRDRLRAQCAELSGGRGDVDDLCRLARDRGLSDAIAPVCRARDEVRACLSYPEVRAFLCPPV